MLMSMTLMTQDSSLFSKLPVFVLMPSLIELSLVIDKQPLKMTQTSQNKKNNKRLGNRELIGTKNYNQCSTLTCQQQEMPLKQVSSSSFSPSKILKRLEPDTHLPLTLKETNAEFHSTRPINTPTQSMYTKGQTLIIA